MNFQLFLVLDQKIAKITQSLLFNIVEKRMWLLYCRIFASLPRTLAASSSSSDVQNRRRSQIVCSQYSLNLLDDSSPILYEEKKISDQSLLRVVDIVFYITYLKLCRWHFSSRPPRPRFQSELFWSHCLALNGAYWSVSSAFLGLSTCDCTYYNQSLSVDASSSKSNCLQSIFLETFRQFFPKSVWGKKYFGSKSFTSGRYRFLYYLPKTFIQRLERDRGNGAHPCPCTSRVPLSTAIRAPF